MHVKPVSQGLLALPRPGAVSTTNSKDITEFPTSGQTGERTQRRQSVMQKLITKSGRQTGPQINSMAKCNKCYQRGTNQIIPRGQPKRKGLTLPDWEGMPPSWAFKNGYVCK